MKNLLFILVLSMTFEKTYAAEPAPCDATLVRLMQQMSEQLQQLQAEQATLRALVLAAGQKKIQSLSVMVPQKTALAADGLPKCVNKCAMCCSQVGPMHVPNRWLDRANRAAYESQFRASLTYSRDQGAQTIVLTGMTEPEQNRPFLEFFAAQNARIPRPFVDIQIQTSGTLLTSQMLDFLRDKVGVRTIALSVSALDSEVNAAIVRPPHGLKKDLPALAKLIKAKGFRLRLCFNMSEWFNDQSPEDILKRSREEFGADQVTFRKLWETGGSTPQEIWIREHGVKPEKIAEINAYIREHGRIRGLMEFGAAKYSIFGMSVIVDEDSMGQQLRDFAVKHQILREDGGIYEDWKDLGSRVF